MASSIAVLMACHNRRATTLACLDALFSSRLPENTLIKVFLVDDGSTDGTAEGVRDAWPEVEIIRADGSLFWAKATALAFTTALDIGFDAYLWLNDDTILESDALLLLVGMSVETGGRQMIVGATCDAETQECTYGGGPRLSPIFRPFRSGLLAPNGKAQQIDMMNGNVVFIPDAIARRIGNLDAAFEHAMGDTDYSLRARRLGIEVVLSPKYVGTCSRNTRSGTFRDKGMGMRERFAHAFSRKGLPIKSWLRFCMRHGGPFWPIHFAWAYVKILLNRA